ncbi:MAG TPA: DUF2806 domain-containing protein [Tepidisphaeraceae bacterium]|jgi:hypothetical protein
MADAKLRTTETNIEVAELLQDAKHRLIATEVRRQVNINSVAARSLEYQPAEGDDIQCRPPTIDWMAWFMDGCQDVSDEAMQKWWAKMLAGEVKASGSFSRRAMSVLRDMDSVDGKGFEKMAAFAWSRSVGVSVIPIPEAGHFPLNPSEVFRLEACDIVKGKYTPTYEAGETIRAGNETYRFTETMRFTSWLLTPAGSELLRLAPGRDEEYFRKVYGWLNGSNTLAPLP